MLDCEKLNPQYNQNSVLTMPWIAWGVQGPPGPSLGYGPAYVVCPSVCPSVTLVDCDHIGWKTWKLIAQTISPTPSLFVARRRIGDPPTPRGTWGNLGETRGEVGKNGVLENKSDDRPISKTSKDRGKVTTDDLYKLSNARTVPFPTPYGLPFPKIGVHNPPPSKTAM